MAWVRVAYRIQGFCFHCAALLHGSIARSCLEGGMSDVNVARIAKHPFRERREALLKPQKRRFGDSSNFSTFLSTQYRTLEMGKDLDRRFIYPESDKIR